MNERRAIIIGLVILAAVAAYPIWYTLGLGSSEPPPDLVLPAGETSCVEDKDYMTASHMELLIQWRDAVVREGQRFYTSSTDGKEYEMSLTQTCIGCHSNKDTFCDRCHTYADVSPYCWDCHLETLDRDELAGGVALDRGSEPHGEKLYLAGGTETDER